MKRMKTKTVYITLGVLLVVAIALILVQRVNMGKEITESGEEINTCGEGTVIHTNENLCWQRSVRKDEAENWQDANDYCDNLDLAGKDNWRLPTADELTSIVDESKENLAIDEDLFLDTKPSHYWTSSEYRDGIHWYIHFELGYQGFAQDFREDYGVRCVRANTLF